MRTKRGVTPTEAGRTLYRHAQVILRQCEQAPLEMTAEGPGVAGSVPVGTAASMLGLPSIRTLRSRYPGIIVYLNENYSTVLSELIMNGIAIYSEADAGACYVHSADQALCIGPASPGRSYLNQAAIPGATASTFTPRVTAPAS